MGEVETCSKFRSISINRTERRGQRAAMALDPGPGMDGKNVGLGREGWSTLSPWRSRTPSGCQVYGWDKDTGKMWTEFIYDWRLQGLVNLQEEVNKRC